MDVLGPPPAPLLKERRGSSLCQRPFAVPRALQDVAEKLLRQQAVARRADAQAQQQWWLEHTNQVRPQVLFNDYFLAVEQCLATASLQEHFKTYLNSNMNQWLLKDDSICFPVACWDRQAAATTKCVCASTVALYCVCLCMAMWATNLSFAC